MRWNTSQKASKIFAQNMVFCNLFFAPYSSNQLGVPERYWRTLAKMARTFINSSKLYLKFWVRAFDTANQICYRISSKTTPGELSPFELFNCRKPNLGYMKTFDCKFFSKAQTHQRKLQLRAKLGVFCGYESSRCYISIRKPEKLNQRDMLN